VDTLPPGCDQLLQVLDAAHDDGGGGGGVAQI